jgi:hypothetical protein
MHTYVSICIGFLSSFCSVFLSMNVFADELGRRELPIYSSFHTPTIKEKDAIFEWVSNWELFPHLNDPYAMSVDAIRVHNNAGKMPTERFSVNSFIVAESREESQIRVIFAMDDPIQAELRSLEPTAKTRGFMGPRRSAALDFLRVKDETFFNDGGNDEGNEIDSRTKRSLDPFRVCCSMGVFLPEHIGLNNIAGKESVIGLPAFHTAYKKDSLLGIFVEGNFTIAYWEHVYEPSYRLNTFVYFKDEVPVYFQNGITNGPFLERRKVKSQGFAAVEWSKVNNSLLLPSRLLVVDDQHAKGFEYELSAKIKWKVDKEVNPKFFDKKTVGKLSMADF